MEGEKTREEKREISRDGGTDRESRGRDRERKMEIQRTRLG